MATGFQFKHDTVGILQAFEAELTSRRPPLPVSPAPAAQARRQIDVTPKKRSPTGNVRSTSATPPAVRAPLQPPSLPEITSCIERVVSASGSGCMKCARVGSRKRNTQSTGAWVSTICIDKPVYCVLQLNVAALGFGGAEGHAANTEVSWVVDSEIPEGVTVKCQIAASSHPNNGFRPTTNEVECEEIESPYSQTLLLDHNQVSKFMRLTFTSTSEISHSWRVSSISVTPQLPVYQKDYPASGPTPKKRRKRLGDRHTPSNLISDLFDEVCAGCGKALKCTTVTHALNKLYHVECFKCYGCNKCIGSLGDDSDLQNSLTTFVTVNDKNYHVQCQPALVNTNSNSVDARPAWKPAKKRPFIPKVKVSSPSRSPSSQKKSIERKSPKSPQPVLPPATGGPDPIESPPRPLARVNTLTDTKESVESLFEEFDQTCRELGEFTEETLQVKLGYYDHPVEEDQLSDNVKEWVHRHISQGVRMLEEAEDDPGEKEMQATCLPERLVESRSPSRSEPVDVFFSSPPKMYQSLPHSVDLPHPTVSDKQRSPQVKSVAGTSPCSEFHSSPTGSPNNGKDDRKATHRSASAGCETWSLLSHDESRAPESSVAAPHTKDFEQTISLLLREQQLQRAELEKFKVRQSDMQNRFDTPITIPPCKYSSAECHSPIPLDKVADSRPKSEVERARRSSVSPSLSVNSAASWKTRSSSVSSSILSRKTDMRTPDVPDVHTPVPGLQGHVKERLHRYQRSPDGIRNQTNECPELSGTVSPRSISSVRKRQTVQLSPVGPIDAQRQLHNSRLRLQLQPRQLPDEQKSLIEGRTHTPDNPRSQLGGFAHPYEQSLGKIVCHPASQPLGLAMTHSFGQDERSEALSACGSTSLGRTSGAATPLTDGHSLLPRRLLFEGPSPALPTVHSDGPTCQLDDISLDMGSVGSVAQKPYSISLWETIGEFTSHPCHKVALYPYTNFSCLDRILSMTKYFCFVLTDARDVPKDVPVSQRPKCVKDLLLSYLPQSVDWKDLDTGNPHFSVYQISKRRLSPEESGKRDDKFVICCHDSIVPSLSVLNRMIGGRSGRMRFDLLIDFERVLLCDLLSEIQIPTYGITYMTDQFDTHHLHALMKSKSFRDSTRSNIDPINQNPRISFSVFSLHFEGSSDATGFLKLTITPHRESNHVWVKPPSLSSPFGRIVWLRYLNVYDYLTLEFAKASKTVPLDGFVLNSDLVAFLKCFLSPIHLNTILPKIVEISDPSRFKTCGEAVKEILCIASCRGWRRVGSTIAFFSQTDDMMDEIFDWSALHPEEIHLFYTDPDSFHDILNSFQIATPPRELMA